MESETVKWILKDFPETRFESQDAIPKILLQLLVQRGISSSQEVDRFLRPKLRDLGDPFELPDMDAAVERIFKAVDAGENILIYGDYDVDGITSVTLMLKTLKAYGVEPEYFIPKRGEEGYGLSEASIQRLCRDYKDINLLITVDCGTASIEEVAALYERGIEVIVVDHHELSANGVPRCEALVNPKLGNDYEYLCAAGVVFKLAHAMMKKRRVANFDLKECLDLVAMATISDIVPLVRENRLLVRHGLSRLGQTSNLGLQVLKQIADLTGRVTSMDVGFRIGPRINAAGRMDRPEEALKLLMTDDINEARMLGKSLDSFNVERQSHEKMIREQAMEMLDENFDPVNDPVIVLGSRNWHPGVVGIVASRLMRLYYKPTFMIAIDDQGVGKGSGRSIEGVSLIGAIQAGNEYLITGGGHEMAAGLSIHEDQLDGFRESFKDYVLAHTDDEARKPRIHVDAEINFEELSLDFLDSYDLLQPFGSKNPQPVFMSRDVWLTEAPRRLKNQHIKLFMRQHVVERDAIFFGGGDRDLPDPPWDIAFTIDRNTFRGVTSLQMVIQDIRAAVLK